ncbi:CDP-glycerol glycerophosphotransferase family protein [Rossellomorea vietnamensis]|uniref:CDP-glycerol glycerophosphotransferase family protein n=1 Tax=Rossellomorea vietnamensis TaxID=218284 RepID=UPI002271F63E|nr:CDP-glycerol glycerophosphotransferase family protein [Rossellomorea vietnamensis]MCC5803162.1 CDP-glycerol glycerophosphotransferase family protein [Rossellomorea vietnamensis]
MIRELAITLYLFCFKLCFSIFKLMPLQKKVCFVATFGDNHHFILEEMNRRQTSFHSVVLKTKTCHYPFEDVTSTIITYDGVNPVATLKAIYHLATSKVVVIDNYYGFLAATPFKDGVECIQVWHAGGAIKKFGLMDPSNVHRSHKAIDRFHQVYQQFHKVVVGSEGLSNIYYEAFGIQEHHILPFGIPRTDLFYNQNKMETVKRKLNDRLPVLRQKKVILYAPTYRDSDLSMFKLHLDLDLLHKHFSETHVLLLKFHRAIHREQHYEEDYKGFVFDLTDHPNINDLLLVTDILITDYSSIPFEYSILEKPMIFFPYDLEEYKKERGFWMDYKEFVPGPVALTNEEIVRIIKSENFDLRKVSKFKEDWNMYSDGHSSANLVQYLESKCNGK